MSIWWRLATCTYIETKRLSLRPFSSQDLADFYAIVSNKDNLVFLFPQLVSKDETKEVLTKGFLQQPLGKWAIAEKSTGQMIGAIQFEKIEEKSRQAEIGYFLRQDRWNQGLMTEALQALVTVSFERLNLKELQLITHLENLPSQRVAQKVGFQKSRLYKGSDRYSHKMRQYLSFTRKNERETK